MGWISVALAHKFVNLATLDQHRRARFLRGLGIEPHTPVDPKDMVSDGDFYAMIEQLADHTPGGRVLAVRVGASMTCDEYGAFGLAFKTASTLAGSYARVARYGRIITSLANFRLVPDTDTSFLEVIPAVTDRPGVQMTNELALAAATALSREVCRDRFTPVAVHIAHKAPGDTAAYRDHFQCPIHFQAGRDALEIAQPVLNSPNRLADAGISAFFDSHLDDAVTDLPKDVGLIRRVRNEIAQTLSEGIPKLPAIAKQLGMSGRTLQRRLATTDHSFQSLVEHSQRELAGRLLRTTDHSIMEVAFLSGFTDQSTFTRAFKRWHGHTPREHRLRIQ